MTEIRKGQQPAELTREQFHERFMRRFMDPAYRVEHEAIARLETIAWQAMKDGRKAPITRRAGNGFQDPDYEASVEWLDTHQRLKQAQQRWATPPPARGCCWSAAATATTAPAPARCPRPGA